MDKRDSAEKERSLSLRERELIEFLVDVSIYLAQKERGTRSEERGFSSPCS